MSTATKLEYLNETKSLLKDSINSLGGNITSQTTFRQYATELDSIYSRLPKVSGTGSILSLSPTLKGRLGSVLKGNTQQDGTPSPSSPIEIQSATGLQKVSVEGKNLLDTQYFENGSIDGTTGQNVSAPYNARGNNYISVIPNTTYTISANTILTNLRLSEYTNSKTNIQRDVISNNNKLTITTTANTYYLRWSLNYNNSTEITQEIIDSLDLQLELGSTATEYEPYQSQEYEINLGKNLLPYDLAKLKSINNGGTWEGDVYTLFGVTYTYNEDGSLTLGGNATGLSYINLYISNTKSLIDENTTYTYSKGITNINIPIAIYEYINNSWVSKKYVTTPSTTYTPSGEQTGQIIRLLVNNGTDLSTPITVFPMIVKGSEATSYSPYFTPIHLFEGDQIIGTPNNWSIKHVMGEVVLDGSENWADRPNYTYADRFVYGGSIERIANVGYSNYFQIKTVSSNDYPYLSINGSQTVINFSEKGTTTLAQFKTWLSTHNTKVVYELAEPTTEPITNTELIEDLNNFYNAKSYNGQTNISVEGDLQMILDVSAIIGD